ncbi:DVL [Artemisia annua]|uniref:DVL n=1 Tax=Artemisia annua TaxID=35608 RepID=A0A2U1MHP2_ARTAN|nr:DVL [Artemisia annua]
MDKKWKLSKEDPCSHSSKSSSLLRSMSQKSSTKSPLLRSFSTKNSIFSRSSSQKNKSPSDLTRSSSQKCANFTRKCGSLAKEQKARFYIVKRCVTMLGLMMLFFYLRDGSDSGSKNPKIFRPSHKKEEKLNISFIALMLLLLTVLYYLPVSCAITIHLSMKEIEIPFIVVHFYIKRCMASFWHSNPLG